MKTAKDFPNGFTAWTETHYEIVQAITIEHMSEHPALRVKEAHESQGHGGLYELAEELTDLFESLHKNVAWDGDFFDEIESFLNDQLAMNHISK